ncbi:KEOPS complex kinase/ATPase Bud32 [Nanoarchaeota archaeon]
MIMSQGAEAIIRKDGNKIVKERLVKDYRIKEIDIPLRKFRTKREAKVLMKLKNLGVPCPSVFSVDDKNMTIEMEFLDGPKVRDILKENISTLSKEIGTLVGVLHEKNIIHADLTTSNMIYFQEKVHLIDFGLSFFSETDEDKAVDLHLLRRALESKHYEVFNESWKLILDSYKETNPNHDSVLKRLEKVESRGRHKKK